MKIKKIAAFLAASVMSLGLLSGCGGNNTSQESQSTTQSVPQTEEVVIEEFDDTLTALEFTSQINVGWNLGNTMDATGTGLASESSWGNPKTTPEMIKAVKDAGFNAIRLPVSWGTHLDENNNIDPQWLARVKEIVDYAYDIDMYIILNTHHEEWYDPYEDNKAAAGEKLAKVWSQIAEEFKGYDEHLIFEGMNEPRWRGTSEEWSGGNDEGRAVVNYFNDIFIDTVRAAGGNNEKRFLMICPYAANCSEATLSALEIPEDDKNIIVSVHAYIPYNFALQDGGSAKWLPDKATCIKDIDTLAEVLDRLFISKGTAVIIGETGARSKYIVVPKTGTEDETITVVNDEYRIQWAEYYFAKFKALGIPCFWWDNGAFVSGETFGMLKRSALEWRYPELLDAVMRGAGVK